MILENVKIGDIVFSNDGYFYSRVSAAEFYLVTLPHQERIVMSASDMDEIGINYILNQE